MLRSKAADTSLGTQHAIRIEKRLSDEKMMLRMKCC